MLPWIRRRTKFLTRSNMYPNWSLTKMECGQSVLICVHTNSAAWYCFNGIIIRKMSFQPRETNASCTSQGLLSSIHSDSRTCGIKPNHYLWHRSRRPILGSVWSQSCVYAARHSVFSFLSLLLDGRKGLTNSDQTSPSSSWNPHPRLNTPKIQHPRLLLTPHLHLLLPSRPAHISRAWPSLCTCTPGVKRAPREVFWPSVAVSKITAYVGRPALIGGPNLGCFSCFGVCMDLLVTSPVIREECFLLDVKKKRKKARSTSEGLKPSHSFGIGEMKTRPWVFGLHNAVRQKSFGDYGAGTVLPAPVSERWSGTVSFSTAVLFPPADRREHSRQSSPLD